jgi:hypothetical protein
MLQGILGSLIPGLFKLGDKLIEDKDKKNEFAFRVLEMAHELSLKLIDTKTYPWIDGLVKLAYASEAIVKGLLRPLGSAAMTGFAIYADLHGIELSAGVEAVLYAAFPAWGASRHAEKAKKQKEEESDYGW